MSLLIFNVPAFVAGSQTIELHLLLKKIIFTAFLKEVQLNSLESGSQARKQYLHFFFFMIKPDLMEVLLIFFVNKVLWQKGGRGCIENLAVHMLALSWELFLILPTCSAIGKQEEQQPPVLKEFVNP